MQPWGRELRCSLSAARRDFCNKNGIRSSVCPLDPPQKLVLGTDCSGADAPVFALKAMGWPFIHAWSCDNAVGPQTFIKNNCSPGTLFTNLFEREVGSLPPHSVYCAGFPCKAFSLLNSKSRLLAEASARPFWGVLATIREACPPLVILENVVGLRRVLPTILKHLVSLRHYFVLLQQMDPTHMGEPVRRPRLYFLLIRRDIAVSQDVAILDGLMRHLWNSLANPAVAPLRSRLLPNSHPLVEAFACKKRRAHPAGHRKANRKWLEKHCAFRTSQGVPTHSAPDKISMLLTGPREKDAWATLAAKFPAPGLTADVSQCITRRPVRTDDTLPTITPGAVLCVRSVGRVVIPAEKLLLNGFPLDKLRLDGLSDAAIASLGGNTMHVRCVAAALAIAAALSNGVLAARPPPSNVLPQCRLLPPLLLAQLKKANRKKGKPPKQQTVSRRVGVAKMRRPAATAPSSLGSQATGGNVYEDRLFG